MRRLVSFSLILFNLLTFGDVFAEITYDDANNPNGLNRLERIKESEKQIQGLEGRLDSLKSTLNSQTEKINRLEELRGKIELINKEVSTLKESIIALKNPVKTDGPLNATDAAKVEETKTPKREYLDEVILLKNEDTRINEELKILRRENASFRESIKNLEQMIYDLNSKAQFKKPNVSR